jgi:hypothetical protein
MPHGHGVVNWSQTLCSNGRLLDIRESRSLTQIFQWNLLFASHRFLGYVRTFGADGDDGDGDDGDDGNGDNSDGDDGNGDDCDDVGVGDGDIAPAGIIHVGWLCHR